MILVNPSEQQRAVVHDDDVLDLIWLQYAFVFRPRDVLHRWVRLDVALDHAGQSKRQILYRGGESYSSRNWK